MDSASKQAERDILRTARGVLYLGDAERILREVPDQSVDFIITSPPYNIGMKYEGYDDSNSEEDYKRKMSSIFRECYRVLVRGGRMIVNTAFALRDKNTGEVKAIDIKITNIILQETEFRLYDRMIWVKSGSENQYDSSTSWGSWCSPSSPNLRGWAESLNIYYKETRKYVKENSRSDITEDEFKTYTNNVWFFRQARYKYNHPCTFDIDMVKAAIKMFTYIDDLVLDPFCGVGSALIAAVETERRYIGIEISKRYFDIARQRIAYALTQKLF